MHLETDEQEYADLELSGRWTSNDLIKWNNLTVEVLSG